MSRHILGFQIFNVFEIEILPKLVAQVKTKSFIVIKFYRKLSIYTHLINSNFKYEFFFLLTRMFFIEQMFNTNCIGLSDVNEGTVVITI